ncbi:MAG: hydroxyacid dehydrogenase [Candidatus Pacebacteria bacterium]|nr:hydroxyacid dehydrogenase [Candidatus Paceibacterota bacterium]
MNKIAFVETTEWERDILNNFPQFVEIADFYPQAINEENASEFQDYEIISSFINSKFNREVLNNLPNLKFIATRSTGFDHIDLQYCQEKQIMVSNVPSYGSHTVAEYTFGLLLCLVRKIYQAYDKVRETGSFELTGLTGEELFNKTIGVVGTGRIGKNVLKISRGFEMKMLAFDLYPDEKLAQELGFSYVSRDQLFQESDIITFHLPYNQDTHHFLNEDNIKLVKKGAYIINTSRGGIIETSALYKALKSGQIKGAALDVLEEEGDIKEEQELMVKGAIKEPEQLKTLILNHLLIDLDNVLISPHNAFNTFEGLASIISTTLDNIKAYISNQPQNIVSARLTL